MDGEKLYKKKIVYSFSIQRHPHQLLKNLTVIFIIFQAVAVLVLICEKFFAFGLENKKSNCNIFRFASSLDGIVIFVS
jgi:hypothetical protein